MRLQVIAAALLLLGAVPAAAQLTPEQARAKADKAPVTVVIPDGTWRGQLVDMDAETVTILTPGGGHKALKLADVLRVNAKKKDSPADGALVGMLAMVAWCALVCGQGANTTGDYVASILSAGVTGLGVGAMVDAGHRSNLVLYKRPAATVARRSPGVFVTVRF